MLDLSATWQRNYRAGLSGRSDKYSPEQMQIALSIAKGEKAGVDSRGRTNYATRGGRALEIASQLFAEKPAPAPAPAPDPAPAPAPAAQLQIAELTAASEKYRTESEQQLAAANTKIAELSNEDLQRQKAIELQNRLAIQSAASKARGQAQANLQIAPASATPMTAGTQAFKRRRMQFIRPTVQTTSKLNVPTSSVLNI